MKRRKNGAPKRGKKVRGVEAPPPAEPPAELPDRYGRTRVVLMEVDPLHLYAYWEVTPEDQARARRALPKSRAWALRFHDVTREGGGFFDIPIDLASGSWYVELWADEKTYVAEIGPLNADGRFVPVCRSNAAHTPRSTPSPRYDPRWMNVDADVPPPLKPGPGSPAEHPRDAFVPAPPPAVSELPPPAVRRTPPRAAPDGKEKRAPRSPVLPLHISPAAAPGGPESFGFSSGLWGRPDGPSRQP